MGRTLPLIFVLGFALLVVGCTSGPGKGAEVESPEPVPMAEGEGPDAEAPGGEMPEGETPEGETAEGETPEGDTAEGETPEEVMPEEETPEEVMPEEETPEEVMPEEETPEGETPEGETPEGEAPDVDAPGEEDLVTDQPTKEMMTPPEEEEEVDITKADETGTDPRGFGTKFMPYYWYGSMRNDLRVRELHLFGMFPFDERVALTYDWAVSKEIDYSRVKQFRNRQDGKLSPVGADPGRGASGFPIDELAPDGDEVGSGDLNLRLFYMPKAADHKFDWGFGPKGEDNNLNFIFGVEGWFPTATEDLLGNDALILSPLITMVIDTPFYGMFAMMNFYHFDVMKDEDRPSTSKYLGRWFLMQPLSKPGPNFQDGWYLMPEFQPAYDFHNDEFSFWVGPEVGKIVGPGKIVYAKPGWGVDPDKAEREFTFEFGFRWFFD
jgi:hypothetical protein